MPQYPVCTAHLVLGVHKVCERAQLLQLVLVLVHLDQGSVIFPDLIERILIPKQQPAPRTKPNKYVRVASIW